MSVFTDKLAVLGKTLNCELESEGNKAAFLIDDVPYDLHFEEKSGNLMLFSCLVTFPEDLALATRIPVLTAVYQKLLQAQYCFAESGGFSFGVDLEASMVNLQALLPLASLSDDEFIALVEKFVRLTNVWCKRLEAIMEDYLADASSGSSKISSAEDASAAHPESFIIRG